MSSDGKITQEMKMKNRGRNYSILTQKKFEEENGDVPSGDDKLQALAEVVNGIEERLAKVEEQLSAAQGDIETIAEVVDTEEFASLRDNLPTILTNFSKLDKKLRHYQSASLEIKAAKALNSFNAIRDSPVYY
jgi:predicted  nucleic acid-binding Zn-ribbon protein